MLDDAAFAACMAPLQPFEDHPLLAIAVSGGADSLALTLLADRWAKRHGGRAVGLTVDHGLRPGSADEAERTGRWLQVRDIEHHTLPWQGEKPKSGLQRRAREARYGLLADWCRKHGCLHLLTAHHRGDQAETVAIRQARQSGPAGLAGIASIREIQGLRLLRPLLGVDKADLIRFLRAQRQPWIEDPTNDDPAFTRNRLRKAGLDIRALAKGAESQGVLREANDRRVAETLVHLTVLDPAGFAWIDAEGFAALSEDLADDLASDLLSRVLITIGGRRYPPRSQSLSRLIETMRNEPADPAPSPTSGPLASRTLAYCRILRRRNRWLICREAISAAPAKLESGRSLLFDDRFLAILRAPIEGLSIAPLDEEQLLSANLLTPKEKNRKLPAAVKLSLPALYRSETLIAVPHLGLYQAWFPPEALDLRFCPRTPLADAPFKPHISAHRPT